MCHLDVSVESVGYLVVKFEVHEPSLKLVLSAVLGVLRKLGLHVKLAGLLDHLLGDDLEAALVAVDYF